MTLVLDMEIIVHQILKQQRSKNVTTRLSDACVTDSPLLRERAELLHQFFRKQTGIKNGFFGQDSNFRIGLDTMLDEYSKDKFIAFSKESILELANTLRSIPLAAGGYYIFVYQPEKLSVFKALGAQSLDVEFSENHFELKDTSYLDLSNMVMGATVDLVQYSVEGSTRYLSFTGGKNRQELPNYFPQWISAENYISDNDNTDRLVTLLRNSTPPLIETEDGVFRTPSKDEWYQRIHGYLQDLPNREVNLVTLSQALFNDPSYIQAAITDPIDGVFNLTRSPLKRLVKLDVAVQGIKMTIDYEKLNDDTIQLSNDNTVVYINSPELARKILEERNAN